MANNKNCKLNGGDFISLLPNDVLLIILSKLNMAEQARTSILSSRWTNLWTFNTCCSDIDAADFMRRSETKSRKIEFINAVDQVLNVHRGRTINQLKLAYPPNFYEISGEKLDSWIDIAKQKQVKVLYLDLGRCVRIFSFGSATFSSLVTLTLKNVSLSGEIIHNLLSYSPNLVELSIIESACDRLDMSIRGSSLKLKHLELKGILISFLEISAPNLVSFSFSTRIDVPIWPRTCFKHIPLLVQLSCPLGLILHAWHEFYSLLPQLVTLALTVSKDSIIRDINNSPTLLNLKQMHVRSLSGYDEGGLLHWLSRLFKASPHLCRLSFDLGSRVLKHSLIENFPGHEFLDELEVLNINGSECEVQPLISILMSCPSLRKITIQSSSYRRKVYQKCVKSAVKELAAKLPQKELTIVFKARNGPNTNKF